MEDKIKYVACCLFSLKVPSPPHPQCWLTDNLTSLPWALGQAMFCRICFHLDFHFWSEQELKTLHNSKYKSVVCHYSVRRPAASWHWQLYQIWYHEENCSFHCICRGICGHNGKWEEHRGKAGFGQWLCKFGRLVLWRKRTNALGLN